jgi:hypothetical protein
MLAKVVSAVPHVMASQLSNSWSGVLEDEAGKGKAH